MNQEVISAQDRISAHNYRAEIPADREEFAACFLWVPHKRKCADFSAVKINLYGGLINE